MHTWMYGDADDDGFGVGGIHLSLADLTNWPLQSVGC